MTEAVAEFGKHNQSKLDVYFVVFPKDNEMLEVIYANYVLCFSVTEFFNLHLVTKMKKVNI